MKNIQILSFLLFLIVFSACEPEKETMIFTLTNTSDHVQTDAIISIQGAILEKVLARNPQPFQVLQGDKNIAYQLDDLDADGKIDELLIMDDFEPVESKEYQIVKAETAPVFKNRTNIHFALKEKPDKELNHGKRLTPNDTITSVYFQMEGPAWENDKVAFRNYFDQRNGIDIFGKQVESLILHKVGIEGQNYHELDDWGMDILKVGASLGAGAIAIKKGDEIYRIDNGSPATYELIKEGPIRSVFELKFENFTIDDHSYQITHRITIEAGKNYYQSDVLIKGLTGDEELVTGIVNLHSDTLYHFKKGKTEVMYTHDLQTENKDLLGMALIIPDGQFVEKVEAPEIGEGIVSSYLALIKLKKGKSSRFYFYSGWEKQNEAFQSRESFEKTLQTTVDQLNRPIKIELK